MAWDYWPAIEPRIEGQHCDGCDCPILIEHGQVAFEQPDEHGYKVRHATCHRSIERGTMIGLALAGQIATRHGAFDVVAALMREIEVRAGQLDAMGPRALLRVGDGDVGVE